MIFGAEHRRFIVAINRLLYLRYFNYDFSNKHTSFITLSLSNLYVGDPRRIKLAKQKVFRLLKRWGCTQYVVAKELGALNGRLHFHIVAFQCPFIPANYKIYAKYSARKNLNLSERKLRNNLQDVWGLGRSQVRQGYGRENSAVFYLIKYAKKGLRLQWCSGFNVIMPLVGYIYNVQYDRKSDQVKKRFLDEDLLIEKEGEAFRRVREYCFKVGWNEFISQVEELGKFDKPRLPLAYRLAHLPFH